MASLASERHNPYDYMRPVTDPNLFAGRGQECLAIKEEIDKLTGLRTIAPIVALLGRRRVGKTSILLRAEEICADLKALSARLNVTETMASNQRAFWREVFTVLVSKLRRIGLRLQADKGRIGLLPEDGDQPEGHYTLESDVLSAEAFSEAVLSPSAIGEDLRAMCDAVTNQGHVGIVMMIDEAHLLAGSDDIQRQLRYAVSEVQRFGLMFAGEPSVGYLLPHIILPFASCLNLNYSVSECDNKHVLVIRTDVLFIRIKYTTPELCLRCPCSNDNLFA